MFIWLQFILFFFCFIGAIFEQGSEEVQLAFKFAILAHNKNVSGRRFELQAFVDVINTADAFKLSRLSKLTIFFFFLFTLLFFFFLLLWQAFFSSHFIIFLFNGFFSYTAIPSIHYMQHFIKLFLIFSGGMMGKKTSEGSKARRTKLL